MNTSIIKKIAAVDYHKMTSDEKREILEAQLNTNINRIKVLYPILIILNLILLIVDLINLNIEWDNIIGYKNLLYLHAIILVSLVVFIILIYYCNGRNQSSKYSKCKWILCYGSTIYVLLWSVIISVNAQLIHGQISAYIIGVFGLCSVYILTPVYSFILLFITHLSFVTLIFNFGTSNYNISGNIINSSFLIILAFVISNVNFSSYINSYRSNKIINTMNEELRKTRNNLEKMVQLKTDELHKANQKLIGEINKRHQVQIKALKNKLEYDKEKELLNEKIKYEELKTEFFTNISHELKTPLNMIFSTQQIMNMYIENIKDKRDKNRLKKYNNLVKQNSYRLIRLIENLIDITKIDIGNYKLNLNNHNVVKIVKEISCSVIDYAENKDISLIYNSDIDDKVIACDPDKIERILLNLLSNAVKFTSKNGYIYVTIYKKDEYICISIKDTGIGIPYEMQHSVFERFIQVNSSISRQREGSGIGLALVKSLVQMHDGEIELLSVPDRGSEFIVKFPDKIIEVNSSNGNNFMRGDADYKVERINIEFSDIYF